jgi:ParB family transcriptional regulator, chromosome partitioning protein
MGESEKIAPHRPRLGRGLSSIISSLTGTAEHVESYAPSTVAGQQGKAAIPLPNYEMSQATSEVPLEQITPNPFQPRRDFPAQELAELAASIAKHGVLQPIRLTRSVHAGSAAPFTLVAGERRFRAARAAGLKTIPAVISDATQEQLLQWAVIENVHRSDLNPIERAEAYQQFLNRFGVAQADLAESLGEARSTVANYLRILDLQPEVRQMIASGQVSFGHAKVLAALAGRDGVQVELAKKVAADHVSVRELEALVAAVLGGAAATAQGPTAAAPARPAYLRDLEERLSAAIGTRVFIRPGRARNTGKVVIEYYSLDDFDRVSQQLGLRPE